MNHQSELIKKDIEGYLKQHQEKDLLRFLTCGSVDDGKSTLIGRLLYDTQTIYDDQLASVTTDSKRLGTRGNNIDLALLVDGLQAEREQGITIDVAYRYFSTEKRKFIIADTPGHEQYTRNMATGASTCDLAIILVDARLGIQAQTRRHAYIASLLGIHHIVVAVNKMDLVEYNSQVFECIRNGFLDFSEQLPVDDIRFIPVSALEGDNVVKKSQRMPWYQGTSLLKTLESVDVEDKGQISDFRFPVQYVNRPDLDYRGYSGTIAAGAIAVGDAVQVLPSGISSRVNRIDTYDSELTEACSGQAITLVLEDDIDISRGDMLVKEESSPSVNAYLTATVIWMADKPLVPGRQQRFKLSTGEVTGSITRIHHRVDINTLDQKKTETLALNEIGECSLALRREVVFDSYESCRQTVAFIVIDPLSNATVGAGMIVREGKSAIRKASVSLRERAIRLGHKPAVIVVEDFELAKKLERELFDRGYIPLAVNSDEPGWERYIKNLLDAGLVAILAGADQLDLEKFRRKNDRVLVGASDSYKRIVSALGDLC